MTGHWQLAAGGDAAVGLLYLAVAYFIFVPRVRLHHVRVNKLATATAAIFLSGSVEHFLQLADAVAKRTASDAGHSWWIPLWQALAAGAVLYYFGLRVRAHRLTGTSPCSTT